MKKNLLNISCLILAIGLSSFTNSGKFSLPRFFKYTGSTALTRATLTDINNWVEVSTFISVDDAEVIPAEIEVDCAECFLIYCSGPKTGKLMVDQPSSFQSDVLKAGGFGAAQDDFVQEVFETCYSIYNSSTKL